MAEDISGKLCHRIALEEVVTRALAMLGSLSSSPTAP
jgi:hypothetical protein